MILLISKAHNTQQACVGIERSIVFGRRECVCETEKEREKATVNRTSNRDRKILLGYAILGCRNSCHWPWKHM